MSRRQALQGIGVLALSGPLVACQDDSRIVDPNLGASGIGGAPPASGSPAPPPAGSSAAGGGGAAGRMTHQTAGGAGSAPPVAGSGSAGTGMNTPAAGASGTPSASAGTGGAAGRAGSTAGSGAAGTPAAGAGGMPAAGSGSSVDLGMLDCVMTPAMTEGPFFIDENLNKTDLLQGETETSVTSGLPLELTLGVFRVNGMQCMPVVGAKVDIWHADVGGVYSDVTANFLQQMDTTGKKFLRAYQTTDEGGLVRFKTIYPGWYGSRAVHIHFKIRIEGTGRSGYQLTSQMFFDEVINDRVMAMAAYSTRGERLVRNMNDQVYNGTGVGAGADPTPPANGVAPGASTLVKLASLASGTGYSGALKIGLMMS